MWLVDSSQTNVVLQYIACSGFALFRYDFSIALFSLIWKIDTPLSSIYISIHMDFSRASILLIDSYDKIDSVR